MAGRGYSFPQKDCDVSTIRQLEITMPAACFLYISQLLSVGIFLFNTLTVIKPKESEVCNGLVDIHRG